MHRPADAANRASCRCRHTSPSSKLTIRLDPPPGPRPRRPALISGLWHSRRKWMRIHFAVPGLAHSPSPGQRPTMGAMPAGFVGHCWRDAPVLYDPLSTRWPRCSNTPRVPPGGARRHPRRRRSRSGARDPAGQPASAIATHVLPRARGGTGSAPGHAQVRQLRQVPPPHVTQLRQCGNAAGPVRQPARSSRSSRRGNASHICPVCPVCPTRRCKRGPRNRSLSIAPMAFCEPNSTRTRQAMSTTLPDERRAAWVAVPMLPRRGLRLRSSPNEWESAGG
jgi:hypothetical protein